MPRFRVFVTDTCHRSYFVDAEDAETAQNMVEASDDANVEFGSRLDDAYWAVEHVEDRDSFHTAINGMREPLAAPLGENGPL